MAVEHPAAGGHEVAAVLEALGRCGPALVEAEDAVGDEPRVEPVGQRVGAETRDDQPRGADGLTAAERDDAERDRSRDGHGQPDEGAEHRRRRGADGGQGER